MARVATVGTDADPWLATRPKTWGVRVISAGPSLATLNGVASKIRVAEPWAADALQSLVTWYVDPKAHRVVVGLDNITPRLQEDAQSAFGDLVDLTIQQRPVLFTGRLVDSQPYWGSDRIGTICTAGFEAYQSIGAQLHYGMVTAGHCFSSGTTVAQAYNDCNGAYHSSGNMGQVTTRVYGQNLTDAEFLDATTIGTSVADSIYVGSQPSSCQASNNVSNKVTAAGTSFVGESVCFDGSFTGENCNGVVDAVNVCVQITGGFNECQQDRAYSANGTALAQGGDSGGPVEDVNSNGLSVFGTITAGGCCVNGSSRYWYSDLTQELNALGAGLVAG
jgi:hypothetical protein